MPAGDLSLLVLMGAVCVRIGRMAGREPTVAPPEHVLPDALYRRLSPQPVGA